MILVAGGFKTTLVSHSQMQSDIPMDLSDYRCQFYKPVDFLLNYMN